MSLTKEQIENLIEENNQKLRAELLPMASDAKPKPRTGMINCVSEFKAGDKYYSLYSDGDIVEMDFKGHPVIKYQVNQGNIAWDKATLERLRDLNILNTKARAASAKAGVIDWADSPQLKFHAYWDFDENKWILTCGSSNRRQGGIYFPTDTSLTNFMKSLTPDEQRLFAGGEI
ncbi:MAG: hypothetical protein ABNH21_06795 [Glaciecola sp.]